MRTVDWRELIASNRATIERARGAPAAEGPRLRLHVPAAVAGATAAPLVLVLHGCTQSADDVAVASRMDAAADRHGFVVAYPQQDRAANARGCWNWFEPAHQGREAGEPAALAAVAAELAGGRAPCGIDARRVFVAGFSAGGAMAAILAATHPDVFAAVAVHSGLADRAATSLSGAFSAMARGAGDDTARAVPRVGARVVPSIVVHGEADRTVAPVNGRQALAVAMAANRRAAPEAAVLDPRRPSATARGRVLGGHAYTLHRWDDRRGAPAHALLSVDGLGHAWSGGAAGAAHADPRGPDAAEAIWRFFASAGQAPGHGAQAGTPADDPDRPRP